MVANATFKERIGTYSDILDLLNGEKVIGGEKGCIMSCHSLTDHAKKPDRRKRFNIQTNCLTTGGAVIFELYQKKHRQINFIPAIHSHTAATKRPRQRNVAQQAGRAQCGMRRVPGVPAQVFGRFGFGVDLEGLRVETEELLRPMGVPNTPGMACNSYVIRIYKVYFRIFPYITGSFCG